MAGVCNHAQCTCTKACINSHTGKNEDGYVPLSVSVLWTHGYMQQLNTVCRIHINLDCLCINKIKSWTSYIDKNKKKSTEWNFGRKNTAEPERRRTAAED